MKTFALQSGSCGNSIYVEAGGVHLLFDAGLPAERAEELLAGRGIDIRAAAALIISHDHYDHVSGAGVWQRRFGLPIHLTDGTERRVRPVLKKVTDLRLFDAGAVLEFDGVRVHSFRTPHDAAEGVVFVIDDGRRRLGILTDLGHPFAGLGELLATLDAAYIESNHDIEMLIKSSYPEALKRRIRGPAGHLSNCECADLLARWAAPRLRLAILAHLSERNNTPELALETSRARAPRHLPLVVASRSAPTETFDLA